MPHPTAEQRDEARVESDRPVGAATFGGGTAKAGGYAGDMDASGRTGVHALPAADLVQAVADEPSLLDDDRVGRRHAALLNRASVCSYCGVGCPYTVEPDPRGRERVVPLSDLGLCVKGKTSLMTGADDERRTRLAARRLADDRIRAPMIRGHDGQMKVVSWDEALDRAAWLFLHAREWVGPEAVAIYGNGQKTLEAIWMASLYKLVFRLPTIGANSEHCLASAGAAHELNFGNEASFTWEQFDELARCDVAVLHGTNAFVTFPQAYEKLARNTHALKVVIDPIETDTVTQLRAVDPRTLHVRFRPGGDVAFNLAVARVIFERGWDHAKFLARAVDPESVAALRARCLADDCETEATARRIALPDQDPAELAATIRRYAALLAEPRDGERPRVAFVSSMGINQSTGSYGFSTNLNLLLLTGNVGRPGAGSLRIAGQSNATTELMLGFNGRRLLFNLDPADPEQRAALARALDLPVDNVPAAQGTAVARMADDDRLYCFVFVGTQMTRNMPRLGHWTRRLGRAFNVVIDSFLADGVLEHADVILPALTYTERTGVIQRGDRSLQLQQRVSEPPPLAWSDEQILARLALAIARRLEDPDTAALNELDPEIVRRTFARYLDEAGDVGSAAVFDHAVAVSRELDVYCRLEDEHGEPLSHAALRARAGRGIQWGGDGRYREAATHGEVFPRIDRARRGRARLVCPPDPYLGRLEAGVAPGQLVLISGRGRPGRRARWGRGRYNSGVKTLPITGPSHDDYFVELHPSTLAARELEPDQTVRLLSDHGAVLARVAPNDRVPASVAFIDFVPGEINRLTDYLDSDRITNQSLIKRTTVELRPLAPLETALWAAPSSVALTEVVDRLHAELRREFPRPEDWLATQRGDHREPAWLPRETLAADGGDERGAVSEAAGAMIAFLQRYLGDRDYRASGTEMLRALPAATRDALLQLLLPFLRRMDYQAAMHPVLSAVIGEVRVRDVEGHETVLNLHSAHRSAVLEFKEEIVAIQLFVAVKRAVERLFGVGAVIPREDLAFVSGVAIPCAGDVPAHFLGISPADIDAGVLVHSRAIGHSALIVVDRRRRLAVRVNITTGVLPKDRELTALRARVINKKRSATPAEHRRFFDRLGELIVDYVRTGDENFELFGPVAIDWHEYRDKLGFAPGQHKQFLAHLVARRASGGLLETLRGLGVIDTEELAKVAGELAGAAPSSRDDDLGLGPDASLAARVDHVVRTIVGPVLENDGGRLDIVALDEDIGELTVRFVGSCANCPYSLLSMEQIVKPTLLGIPGIERVVHRARIRDTELEQARRRLRVLDARE